MHRAYTPASLYLTINLPLKAAAKNPAAEYNDASLPLAAPRPSETLVRARVTRVARRSHCARRSMLNLQLIRQEKVAFYRDRRSGTRASERSRACIASIAGRRFPRPDRIPRNLVSRRLHAVVQYRRRCRSVGLASPATRPRGHPTDGLDRYIRLLALVSAVIALLACPLAGTED